MRIIATMLLVLAMGGVGRAGELLNMWPQSQHEAVKQYLDTAEENHKQNEAYFEKRRQEEVIDALHDIEDAVIRDSLNEEDD
jgi:ABC-type methionine transport system ATPase subunit